MKNFVTREQIVLAKRTDLHQYLLKNHYADVVLEGNSVRLKCNHSVSVKVGYRGYYDFETGEGGNAIDCLIKYFGYTFVDAVKSLTGTFDDEISVNHRTEVRDANLSLLEPLKSVPRNLIAYLTKTRLIPVEVVKKLLDEQLMFQESSHNNIVFINRQKTFAEVHGTSTYRKFRGVLKGSDSLGFWWFKSYHIDATVKKVFVCESAIDAMSLYCLHQSKGFKESSMYCSIAGVANQQKIDLLKKCVDIEVILAVDNDSAGDKCRQRNKDLQFEIPQLKDWNDDWRELVNKKSESK